MKKVDAQKKVISAARSIVLSHRDDPAQCPVARYQGANSDACVFCDSETWQDGALIHDDLCEWKALSDAVYGLER